jgi:hypothetical protein
MKGGGSGALPCSRAGRHAFAAQTRPGVDFLSFWSGHLWFLRNLFLCSLISLRCVAGPEREQAGELSVGWPAGATGRSGR